MLKKRWLNNAFLKKALRFIIFFLYTWYIYTFCYFIEGPLFLIYEDGDILLFMPILGQGVMLIICMLGVIIFILNFWRINDPTGNAFLPLLALFVLIGCAVFLPWWRRQTIIRAWLLANMGMVAGPGIVAFFGVPGDGGVSFSPLIPLIGLNEFFFLLFIANFLQKRYFPDNKFCNRIPFILAWPCLRT